jgi:hypothetical protein
MRLRAFVIRTVSVIGLHLLAAGVAGAQTVPAAGTLRADLLEMGRQLLSPQAMSSLATLTSLEVSTAPLGTSTGGFTFTFDPLLRTWKRSATSFGPSFSERGLTTGRAKVSAGFNWLNASYNSLGGQNLTNGDYRPAINANNPALNAQLPAPLSYTTLTLNMKSNTLVMFGHVGVTDNFDVGVAVPWVHIQMDGRGGYFSATGVDVLPAQHPTIEATSASGVGDVAVFGKYRVLSQPGGGLAAEVELRLPSGDKDQLRGLGVTRTLVSGIWSQAGKISPHANIGYEFWSDSVPISADGTVYVQNQFKYAFGVEFDAHPRATVLLDLVGRRLLHGGSLEYQTFPATDGQGHVAPGSIDALVGVSKSIGEVSLVPGIKWNVWRSVLLTGNVLTTLSNDGLRANVIPVVGVDWAF